MSQIFHGTHRYLKNYSLFIWNFHLTGCLVILFAKSYNCIVWGWINLLWWLSWTPGYEICISNPEFSNEQLHLSMPNIPNMIYHLLSNAPLLSALFLLMDYFHNLPKKKHPSPHSPLLFFTLHIEHVLIEPAFHMSPSPPSIPTATALVKVLKLASWNVASPSTGLLPVSPSHTQCTALNPSCSIPCLTSMMTLPTFSIKMKWLCITKKDHPYSASINSLRTFLISLKLEPQQPMLNCPKTQSSFMHFYLFLELFLVPGLTNPISSRQANTCP